MTVDDDDKSASLKPSDTEAGETSSTPAKVPVTPWSAATVPGKGVLKNIKTMFYVGTEVSFLPYFSSVCRSISTQNIS